MPPFRIEVLGPVRLLIDGQPVEVRGERRTAVLAMLALAGGRVVPFETLVDSVWGEEPPDGARQALHSLLSRLRSHLGAHADRLERQGNGYLLRLAGGELDVADVRALAAEARALADVDPAKAADILKEALALWRGPALAGLASIDGLRADAVALDELLLGLEEEQLEAELAAGARTDVVERCATAVAAHPTREARQLLLMRALAQTGRAADALRAANEYRRRLADDTGLDPSPALALLEGRIAAGEMAQESTPAPAPLQTVAAPPPRFRTPLLGRVQELADLRQLLDDEHLVAVVGPPGVGKTRLAAEVASALADDGERTVTFVSLATVDATTSLATTLAGALGVRVGPGQTALGAAVERLRVERHLVVLDNCEHVLGALRDLVSELLVTCPLVGVLLTSRVPSGLAGERVVRVPPLDGTSDAALQLFVDRAGRVRPGFSPGTDGEAVIAEIVRRLDGLPLAIELAAGRLSTLSLSDLAGRIDTALDLLGGQRTLRSTLDWSYQLLEEPQRLLLRHLAEFADGIDLSGVESVADATGLAMGGAVELAALVDASLVDARLDDEPRYRMLETVRALARDRQRDVPGESERARAVMIAWAQATAAEIDALCRTPAEPTGDRRLRRELANLRAAHHAALQSGDIDAAVDITVSLDMPASLRDLPEVWSWAMRLADWADIEGHPRYGDVLGAAAEAAWLQGDLDGAEAFAQRAVAAGQRTPRCTHSMAALALFRGTPAQAIDLWREAAEVEPFYLPSAGLAAVYAGDLDLAAELCRTSMAWATDHGAPSDAAWVHYVTGEMGGDEAQAQYEAAIDLSRRAGATFVEGVATVGLAARLAASGADDEALATFDRLIRYWQSTGNWTQQWTTLRNLAVLLERRGDAETAAVILASADAATEAAAVIDGSVEAATGVEPLPRAEVVARALRAIAV